VPVWIGLLRAVNVGGRKLSMKDVVAVVSDCGGSDVRTYLQSGNVVFGGSRRIADSVSPALSKAAGFDVPVLLRSGSDLAAVLAGQPLDGPETAWHVTFLAAAPKVAAVSALDPAGYGEDGFVVRRREVYLRTPNGYGRTKLNNTFFERKLGVVVTTRNWRTVCALAEMARDNSR
jgi:uncharacterized protein (DUF1697 family)